MPVEGTNFVLTKHGSLMCGIELAGMDPDGMQEQDFEKVSGVVGTLQKRLPGNVVVTQYYSHFNGVKIHFKKREHPVSNFLSLRRQNFLNQINLSGSKVMLYLEVLPEENLSNLGIVNFAKHLVLSATTPQSRAILKNSLSFDEKYILLTAEMDRQKEVLRTACDLTIKLLTSLSAAREMTTAEVWAHGRFLASLIQSRLQIKGQSNFPSCHWDYHLSSAGEIKPITSGDSAQQYLKIEDAETRYAQIATVRSFGNPMLDGCWGREGAPSRLAGNYIIMTRWHPMGEFKRANLFRNKENEIERSQFKFMDVLKGDEEKSILEKQATATIKTKEKIDELQRAENLQERWGMFQSNVLVFGKDAQSVSDQKSKLDAAMAGVRISVVWEKPGLLDAFKAMQIGSTSIGYRNIPMNTRQIGAAALLFQSSRGQPKVADLQGEEAQYILTSEDGKLFYYSPFVNGRAFVLGVGRTRSGKSHLRKAFSTHFMKYGGLYRSVGIDDGDENLAEIFKEDAGVFRVGDATENGVSCVNPFASYMKWDDGETNEKAVIEHISSMMLLFLAANDDPALQKLDTGEQDELDRKIAATLKLTQEERSLSGLVAQLSAPLQRKFSRWVHDVNGGKQHGRYSDMWGSDQDSIGQLDKRIAIFNLQNIKDNKNMLLPVVQELTFRITSAFYNRHYRHVPKMLDIDEAHVPLQIKSVSEYLVLGSRTWAKLLGLISLWTQSPEELQKVENWEAMRTAFTTLIFFSDSAMNKQLYKSVFDLTDGECEAISKLIPQREAYIIQREIGVSKKVIIHTEPEQNVLNTSHPLEVRARNQLIKEHGFDEGMRLAVDEIAKMRAVKGDVFLNNEEIA